MNVDAAVNSIMALFTGNVMIIIPLFVVTMVVVILVNMLQAMTQLQDQTLSFIPKVLILVFTFYFLGHWMFSQEVHNIAQFIKNLPGKM